MTDDARAALAGWDADQPTNYYDAAPDLGRALRTHVGGAEDLDQLESRLSEFGAIVAHVVDPAAGLQERAGNGPRLVVADVKTLLLENARVSKQ